MITAWRGLVLLAVLLPVVSFHRAAAASYSAVQINPESAFLGLQVTKNNVTMEVVQVHGDEFVFYDVNEAGQALFSARMLAAEPGCQIDYAGYRLCQTVVFRAAVVYTPGSQNLTFILPPRENLHVRPTAMNDNGHVVGYFTDTINANGFKWDLNGDVVNTIGFSFSNGVFTEMPVLDASNAVSYALDVNNDGFVVGYSVGTDGYEDAVLMYPNGTMIVIPYDPTNQANYASVAREINNAGQIAILALDMVNQGSQKAYLFDVRTWSSKLLGDTGDDTSVYTHKSDDVLTLAEDGTVVVYNIDSSTALGYDILVFKPDGTTVMASSSLTYVNAGGSGGALTGYYYPSNYSHAFYYDVTTNNVTDVQAGYYAGQSGLTVGVNNDTNHRSKGFDTNDKGMVVGQFSQNQPYTRFAFAATTSQWIDLSAASGMTLEYAYAVNNNGSILATWNAVGDEVSDWYETAYVLTRQS